jgi:CD109 antigen
MQGGSAEGGVPLTAYVLISLLENNIHNKKAQTYLEENLSQIKDNPYAMAVVSYALHLAESPKKEEALKMLEDLKIVDSGEEAFWGLTIITSFRRLHSLGSKSAKHSIRSRHNQVFLSTAASRC